MLKDDSGLQPQRTYLANERTLFSILATSLFISKIFTNFPVISLLILTIMMCAEKTGGFNLVN